jgi:hypothetical protein
MSPYKENTMMKASIQTSYKLMLMELEYRLDKLQYSMLKTAWEAIQQRRTLLTWIDLDTNNITKRRAYRRFSRTLQHFIAAGRKPRIAMNTTTSLKT